MPSVYMILEQIICLPLYLLAAYYIIPADKSLIFLVSLPLYAALLMLYDYLPRFAVVIPGFFASLVASYYFIANYDYIPEASAIFLYWLFRGGIVLFAIYIYVLFRSYAYHQARCETANIPPWMMIPVNFIIGVFCYYGMYFNDIEIYLYLSVIVSTAVSIVVMILYQVDKSLWHGSSAMKMPHIQKRNSAVFGIIIILILIFSSGAYTSLFKNWTAISIKIKNDSIQIRDLPILTDWEDIIKEKAADPSTLFIVIRDIIAIAAIALIAFLIIRKIVQMIYRLIIFIKELLAEYKTQIHYDEAGYTDIIDNTLFNRIFRRRRSSRQESRWEKLSDDFERIRFIFKEYVLRAENAGMHTTKSQTPRETCDSIKKQADSYFPDPGKLAEYYDKARYGGIKPHHDEIVLLKEDLLG